VDQQTGTIEIEDQVLAPTADPRQAGALYRRGRDVECLCGRELKRQDRLEARTPNEIVEAFG
jgi:hypothetical protein